MGGAYFPRLSQMAAAGDELGLKKIYHEGARLVSMFIISMGIFLVVFPDAILGLWTGNPIFSASVTPLLVPLAIGTMLNGLMNMPFHLQIAFGWTRLSVWSSSLSIIFLAPALFFSVSRFGPQGAAVSVAVLVVGPVFIMVPLVHRKLLRGEYFSWILGDVGKQTGIALALGGIARLVTDKLGITHAKEMWFILPLLGAATLVSVAGASGFWNFIPLHRKGSN
jgi:O-antigen/teichoic acid export membrane protein